MVDVLHDYNFLTTFASNKTLKRKSHAKNHCSSPINPVAFTSLVYAV